MTPPSSQSQGFLGDKQSQLLGLVLWLLLGLAGYHLPLVADEAYYLSWSRSLALGYYDHPPMIAYFIALFGSMPRLTAWLTCGASICLLMLSARALGYVRWRLLPVLFLCTPLGLSSALIATPDTPLLFASSLMLLGLVKQEKRWVILGLCLGLWSKATILLWIPAVCWRFAPKSVGIIILTTLIGYFPHIIWSLGNDGLPWSFQSGRVFNWGWHSIRNVMELIGTQCLLAGPLLASCCYQTLRRAWAKENRLFTLLIAPTIVVSTLVSLGMHVEGNWPMLIWPPMLLLAIKLASIPPKPVLMTLQRVFMIFTVVAAGAITIGYHYIPATFGPDRDGPALAACLTDSFPHRRIVATRYQEVALLSEVGSPPLLLRRAGVRGSQFDLWNRNIIQVTRCDDVVIGDAGGCIGGERSIQRCGRKMLDCFCDKHR